MYWDAQKSVLEVVTECLKVCFGMGLTLNALCMSRQLVVRGMFTKYGSLAREFLCSLSILLLGRRKHL